MGSQVGRFKCRLFPSKELRLKIVHGLSVAGDITLLVLAVLAIYIAYRDYLKTDVQLAITAPVAESIVLNRKISVDGTVSGGPYNGYEVHHKAPGDEQGRLIRAASGEQVSSAVFPISLSLVDEDGSPRIGQHTVTVTLKAGRRNVEQDSVSFEVIDCLLIIPREFTLDTPIHDVIDLRPKEEFQGYDFLYYINGVRWTLDYLDPVHLEDGYHQFRVVAVVPGCEEEVDSVTTNFVVDNTAPIIDSLGLSDGSNVNSRSKVVPVIFEPHLAKLELCVNNEFIGKLEGQALEQRLDTGDLGYTLEDGWITADADAESQALAVQDGTEEQRLKDGWHDVLLMACDVNGLCSTESARVWVDNTCPGLRWDLASDAAIPLLPTDGFWLGGMSPDPEARIVYDVAAPASIVEGEYLDTSACELGSTHVVRATAIDLAGNAETQTALFVLERSSQAWLSAARQQVSLAITSAVAPVSDMFEELASEGMSIGLGVEVSSSLADESVLMWRGVLDFVYIEICPMIGRGIGENTTMGLGFRVPLEPAGLAASSLKGSVVRPILDFGAAVTPNWQILNSLDFGTEQVAETWVKLSLSTVLSIPLSAQSDAALKLDVAPGCKLSFVQEFKRGPEYSDGVIVGVRKFVEGSLKLEVTIDGSIAFSAGQQR